MRKHFIKTLSLGAIICGALGPSFVEQAQAGQKMDLEVIIQPAYKWFAGYAGSARNSLDTNQIIWCSVEGNGAFRLSPWDSPTVSYRCGATDASGRSVGCIGTMHANQAAALAAINGDSFIHVWYEGSRCDGVVVQNGSHTPNKK